MVHRLIDGVTVLSEGDKALTWKTDTAIKHDDFFSEHAEGAEADDAGVDDASNSDEEIFADSRGQRKNRPSILAPMGLPDIEAQCEVVKPMLPRRISVAKINLRIVRLYQAKQQVVHCIVRQKQKISCHYIYTNPFLNKCQADLWASASEKRHSVRLDNLVHRCFLVEYGARSVARRHLRFFLKSVQRYLREPKGEDIYPRMYLFCILTGVINLPPKYEYNPRLAASYFQPALRYIFPNPRVIADVLGDGTELRTLLRGVIQKACTPLLYNLLGGPYAIEAFKRALVKNSEENSQTGCMVNFDSAMISALKLWLFSDSMRKMRFKQALLIVQRFFRAKMRRMRTDDPAQAAVPTSTPRAADRINEARELDFRLNHDSPTSVTITAEMPAAIDS
jgi:hypothetical protein